MENTVTQKNVVLGFELEIHPLTTNHQETRVQYHVKKLQKQIILYQNTEIVKKF